MKELKNSDMAFTFEQVKKGRNVVGIRFFFSPNGLTSLETDPGLATTAICRGGCGGNDSK